MDMAQTLQKEGTIKLCFACEMESGNYGDLLSRYIVERLAETTIEKYDHDEVSVHLDAIGSILDRNEICSSALIWGSGFLSPQPLGKIKLTRWWHFLRRKYGVPVVYAVRGELTREILLKAGIACPKIFGDPALLMPLLYCPVSRPSKTARLGIILHHSHGKFKAKFQNEKIKYIEVCRNYNDMERFIDEMLSCEVILSSSLHGLILANVYKIPCVRLKIPGHPVHPKADREDFKFNDYLSGLNSYCKDNNTYKFATYCLDGKEEIGDQWIDSISNMATVPSFSIDASELLLSFPFLRNQALRGQLPSKMEELPTCGKILFCCTTEFQLLTALNIKYHMHPNDDADIIVANYHGEEKELAERIRNTHLFRTVLYVPSSIEEKTLHKYFRSIMDDGHKIELLYALNNTFRFLKAKFGKWILGPRAYIETMVDNPVALKLQEYDELLTYGTKPLTTYLVDCMMETNRRCRINLLDEGMGIYSDPNFEKIEIVDTCYVYEPSAMMYKKNFVKVPRIQRKDRKFIELLNYVFQFYESDIEDYRNSIIFFDQSVSNRMPKYLREASFITKLLFCNAYKRHLKEDRQFFEQIQVVDLVLDNKLSDTKVWVKLHPRPSQDAIDEFQRKNVALIQRYDLPWELLALNCPTGNNILVTSSSSSVCLYKAVVGEDDVVQCVILGKLSKEVFPEIVYQYFETLAKKYRGFHVPETVEKLALILRGDNT